MNRHLHIAFATDDNYTRHLGVLIASILENSGDETFTFYVLDGGISEENRRNLESLRDIRDFEIQFIPQDLERLKDCPSRLWYTKNTYSRLLLPEVLPELGRILYLDCDMIVRGSLLELWNADLRGKSLGVVPCETEFAYYWKRWVRFRGTYFNAGMLLMDLEKIRKEGTFLETLKWLAENPKKVFCADQDGLNAVFAEDKTILSHRWNWESDYSWHYYMKYTIFTPGYWEAAGNPTIVHYVGKFKPWDEKTQNAYRETYWNALARTPWKEARPQKLRGKDWRYFVMSFLFKKYTALWRKLLIWNMPGRQVKIGKESV